MNLRGKFQVTLLNQKTFETEKIVGENLITNIGKEYIYKWLSRDNYSECLYGDDILSGGKTVLTEKIIPYNEISAKSYYIGNLSSYLQSKNPDFCLYAPNKNNSIYSFISNYSYSNFESMPENYKRECSIYFDFNDIKSIKKIVLQCNPTYYYETTGAYGCQLEISTSPNSSEENTDWTVRKYMMLPNNWNYKYENSEINLKALFDLPIYLGDRDNPEKIIDNVKSIRITPSYYGLKIYNAVFFESVDYPSPPCFIGLGSSSVEPKATDIELGNKICVLKAKCNVSETNVTYRTRLGIKEFNGNTFNEIGLYCFNGAFPYSGQELKLFSHGLFENSWNKNQDIIADIKYVLTAEE